MSVRVSNFRPALCFCSDTTLGQQNVTRITLQVRKWAINPTLARGVGTDVGMGG